MEELNYKGYVIKDLNIQHLDNILKLQEDVFKSLPGGHLFITTPREILIEDFEDGSNVFKGVFTRDTGLLVGFLNMVEAQYSSLIHYEDEFSRVYLRIQ